MDQCFYKTISLGNNQYWKIIPNENVEAGDIWSGAVIGVAVDGEVVKDIKATFTKEQFAGEGIVVKRGKKNFRRVIVK